MAAAAASALAAALAVGLVTGAFPARRAAPGGMSRSTRRREWLVQAGLHLTPAQFWLASIAAGAAAFVLFSLVSGVAAVALAPAVAVALLPRLYFGRRRDRRLLEVQKAWPDGLRDLVSSITAGMSLQRALENLTVTGPEPLRAAFAGFPLLARTIGLVPALEVLKEDLADPTSDRVIEVLIVAATRGGPIVPDILRDLATATTRDVWTLEDIETQALEQKINARAVFVLPWLVLLLLTATEGPFRDFYASRAGLLVVALGGALSGAGALIVARLGREPDEPRVFGGGEGR